MADALIHHGLPMTASLSTTCLPLDSPRWAELDHAYGKAHDTPALLAQLEAFPSSLDNAEPWYSLWSSLAHQGDVYPASFAAVPHVVRALAIAPLRADFAYFQFPAVVEAWRQRKGVQVPEDLLTTSPLWLLCRDSSRRLPTRSGMADSCRARWRLSRQRRAMVRWLRQR